MKQNNQPNRQTTQSNNHQDAARSPYWQSVRRCAARPDGITEIVHEDGLIERYDGTGRPAGLARLRTTATPHIPKRGDLRTLPCHRIIFGPSVIRADGMWKIIYRDGITERFPATRNIASNGADMDCHANAERSHALAA